MVNRLLNQQQQKNADRIKRESDRRSCTNLQLSDFLDTIQSTFAGKYTTTDDTDYKFKKIQHKFFKQAFINDKVYLYYNETKQKFFIYRKTPNDNQYYDLINNQQLPNTTILKEDDLIEFEWDEQIDRDGKWMRFIDDIITMQNSFLISTIFDAKKVKITTTSDASVSQDTINNLMSISPIVKQAMINEDDSLGAKVEPIDFGSSNSAILFSNLNNYWNWGANLLGWTTSQQQKLERKTFSEGLIDIANTNQLDQMTLTNLDILSKEILDKWNLIVKFKETTPIRPIDLVSNQPNQEEQESPYELEGDDNAIE